MINILKILLLLYFFAVTNFGMIERIEQIGYNLNLVVFALLWIMVIFSVFVVAFYTSVYSRVIWGGIFAASSIAGAIFYQSSGGQYFSFNTLSSIWDAKANLGDAFNLYMQVFVKSTANAMAGFVGIVLPYNERFRRAKWLWISPLLPMTLITGVIYLRGGEGTNGLPSQVAPVTIFTVFMVDKAMEDKLPEREGVRVLPINGPKVDNIIMVVDESVRADFLDINNSKNGVKTWLKGNADIINFGWSTSSTNCSLYSNLGLMYGGNEEGFLEFVIKKPSIWAYAKRAGFETYFIGGQKLTEEDKRWIDYKNIDHIISNSELEKENEDLVDYEIANKIKKLINNGNQPRFIYVIKRGSHFPYEKHYPENQAIYKPYMTEASIFSPHNAVSEDVALVINSYKNVLSWNVGIFFKELFSDKLKKPYIMFYTSDHGQKLMSNEESFFTHCNSADISPYESLVPLIVATNDKEMHDVFEEAAKLNFDKTSHLNLFPTMLWLLGYDKEFGDHYYNKLLTGNIDWEGRFVSPPFFTKFGRKQQWNLSVRREIEE